MATAYSIIQFVMTRIPLLIEEQKRHSLNCVIGVDIAFFLFQLDEITAKIAAAEDKRFSQDSVKDWLNKLVEVVYAIEDVVDEWELSIRKFASKPQVLSCIPFSCGLIFKKQETHNSSNISLKMKKMAEEVELIWIAMCHCHSPIGISHLELIVDDPAIRLTASFVDTDAVHGRGVDRDALLRKIMIDGNHETKSDIQVIALVGVAGIGKTTLAQLVYFDSQVRNCFPLRIWVYVSQCFQLVKIAKEILERVQYRRINSNKLDTLLEYLRDSVKGRRFLLVLDDVWTEDYGQWEPLKTCLNFGAKGSTVLVTTRYQMTARMMGAGDMYLLGRLSDESCWSILSGTTLDGRDEHEKYKDIGMKIAKKCNGMPLTAKVLGGLLRRKASIEEWETVLKTEMRELAVVRDAIFPPLNLTYSIFPIALKSCFSYFGVIPRNFDVYAKKLIRCWSAIGSLHGFDSEVQGQKYLMELLMHSLLEDSEQDEFEHVIVCKMYSIVQDFAQFLMEGTSSAPMVATCQGCGTSLVSHVKAYHSLFFQENPPPYICDCLKTLRVLSLRDCDLESIPRDMIKLIHLRLLDLSYNQRLCEDAIKTVCKLSYLETLFLSSCGLQELPMEIGDLSRLSHLDLSFNRCLTRLPETICNLRELRTLELDECESLSELAQEIFKLGNLKHLHNLFTKHSFPGGLPGLFTLNEFSGKLSLLKHLNKLEGSLHLRIPDSCGREDVAEAKEANLYLKESIRELEILFEEDADENIIMDVLDALEPPSCLRYLKIEHYGGSRLPGWIASPLSQVKHIELQQCSNVLCLPALGKLPCLEELTVQEMDGLQCVGREFLGLTTKTGGVDIASSSSSVVANNAIAFPKLKVLIFYECPEWEEWEGITAEEEESAKVSILPCLKKLDVVSCGCLSVLPHRLLQKVTLLEELDIYDSEQLIEVYEDKEGSDWDAISQIPRVRFD